MRALDHIASAFLRRILRRMKELGVNQSELAKRMKVSKPYITKVLRQDVNFSFRTAAKLAQALEMDFFPELRERGDSGSGTGCQRRSHLLRKLGVASADMTRCAKSGH